MSRRFQRFQAELRAEYPAKKDGFDLANLGRLRGDERVCAAEQLREAIAAGDGTAVPALLALDPAEAAHLRAVLGAVDEWVRVRIVAELLSLGPDPAVAAALPTLLASHHVVVRMQAITATGRLQPVARRIELLLGALRAEQDPMNRMMAGGELLRALGRAPGDRGTPDHRECLRIFQAGHPEQVERTVAALGLPG